MRIEKLSAVTFRVLNMKLPCGFTEMFWAWRLSTVAKMRFSRRFAARTRSTRSLI